MRKNKLLLLLALLLTAATGAWAANTVTWTAQNQLPTLEGKTTATIDGVTITTPSAITVNSGRATFNVATFSVTEGNITKIVLKSISGVSDYPTGWTISDYTDATWTGSAKSVSCGYSGGVYSIEFTIENVYTVTMAKGTVDATNWTINPAEAAEGTEVTLQYNGRLKVKGVKATSDAPAAKPAATVTTAPTGAAVVGVGKTTALVSGGVADGGTLMYAVTTTNTKPASTDGFSDAVPTAQTITASGKVYVWYYVKGDDTHSDSEIAATAIEVTVMAVPITVTWNPSDIVPEHLWDDSFTKDGITFTAATCDFQVLTFGGGGSFTNTIGNFTKIEISADFTGDVSGTGWSNDGWQSATWTGNAASVSFSGDIWGGGMTCEGGNLTIVFTIE